MHREVKKVYAIDFDTLSFVFSTHNLRAILLREISLQSSNHTMRNQLKATRSSERK